MSADRQVRPRARSPQLQSLLARFGAGILVAFFAAAAPAQRAVPPAEYRPPAALKATPAATLLLRQGVPVRRIAMPVPSAAEAAPRETARSFKPNSAPLRNKSGRLAIGFARAVPPAEGSLRLADLSWQPAAGGGLAAQVTLTSAGAAGLRLSMALNAAPPQLRVRFQGSASGAPVYGPFAAATVASEPVYWSPALEGDTGTIELELPAGVAPGDARLELPLLSHLNAAGRSLRAFGLNIGGSGACEVDIACLSPPLRQQLQSATKAVARMMVTIQGTTYLCTGTLLNDAQTSFTPYFLTANHCLEDPDLAAEGKGTAAASAGTINTYWVFEAAACGSLEVPNYVVLGGGAKLLARSIDFDWALVRLNLAPPAGTTFAAWNAAAPLAEGTAADGIHHPSGDLKKISRGSVDGYESFSDDSSFITLIWNTGVTEPGSSGSGLFTLNAAGNYFEVRGTLSGGASSCALPQGVDYYTRLDVAYPLVAPYLAPAAANPGKIAQVVEFYSAGQDSYFITADPFEIAGRDNGVPAGWVRTGYRFLAYTDPATAPAAAKPVCRLHAPPPYGDTRFYSASAAECAATLAQTAQHWIAESAAAFYIQAPDPITGACPAGTRPVFRFLDTSSAPRRRYTAEVGLRDALRLDGVFLQEGGGTSGERAAMCAPLDGAALPGPSAANYQGLWWNAPAGSEPGWGVTFAHQGDTLFAIWYTYDAGGAPLWFVVTASRTGTGTYSGPVNRASGPAFNAVPFDPANVTETAVGTATFAFTDDGNGTFAFNVDGVAGSKNITRQVFASPVPECRWGGQTDLALATNYQDLWWAAPAGAEAGWGVYLTQQGSTMFATWFTYDHEGKPRWLAMTAPQTSAKVYAGELFTATGPAFSAAVFDPATVTETTVGTATLAFADGNHATFTYTLNGITQGKQITRQVFAAPGTACF